MDELNNFINSLDLAQYSEGAKLGLYGGTAALIILTILRQLKRAEWAWHAVIMLMATVVCVGGAFVIYSLKEGQYRQECNRRAMADDRAEMWKSIALGKEDEALTRFRALEEQYNRSAPTDFKEIKDCINDIANNNDLHGRLKELAKNRKVEDLLSDLGKILEDHQKNVDKIVDAMKNYK